MGWNPSISIGDGIVVAQPAANCFCAKVERTETGCRVWRGWVEEEEEEEEVWEVGYGRDEIAT